MPITVDELNELRGLVSKLFKMVSDNKDFFDKKDEINAKYLEILNSNLTQHGEKSYLIIKNGRLNSIKSDVCDSISDIMSLVIGSIRTEYKNYVDPVSILSLNMGLQLFQESKPNSIDELNRTFSSKINDLNGLIIEIKMSRGEEERASEFDVSFLNKPDETKQDGKDQILLKGVLINLLEYLITLESFSLQMDQIISLKSQIKSLVITLQTGDESVDYTDINDKLLRYSRNIAEIIKKVPDDSINLRFNFNPISQPIQVKDILEEFRETTQIISNFMSGHSINPRKDQQHNEEPALDPSDPLSVAVAEIKKLRGLLDPFKDHLNGRLVDLDKKLQKIDDEVNCDNVLDAYDFLGLVYNILLKEKVTIPDNINRILYKAQNITSRIHYHNKLVTFDQDTKISYINDYIAVLQDKEFSKYAITNSTESLKLQTKNAILLLFKSHKSEKKKYLETCIKNFSYNTYGLGKKIVEAILTLRQASDLSSDLKKILDDLTKLFIATENSWQEFVEGSINLINTAVKKNPKEVKKSAKALGKTRRIVKTSLQTLINNSFLNDELNIFADRVNNIDSTSAEGIMKLIIEISDKIKTLPVVPSELDDLTTKIDSLKTSSTDEFIKNVIEQLSSTNKKLKRVKNNTPNKTLQQQAKETLLALINQNDELKEFKTEVESIKDTTELANITELVVKITEKMNEQPIKNSLNDFFENVQRMKGDSAITGEKFLVTVIESLNSALGLNNVPVATPKTSKKVKNTEKNEMEKLKATLLSLIEIDPKHFAGFEAIVKNMRKMEVSKIYGLIKTAVEKIDDTYDAKAFYFANAVEAEITATTSNEDYIKLINDNIGKTNKLTAPISDSNTPLEIFDSLTIAIDAFIQRLNTFSDGINDIKEKIGGILVGNPINDDMLDNEKIQTAVNILKDIVELPELSSLSDEEIKELIEKLKTICQNTDAKKVAIEAANAINSTYYNIKPKEPAKRNNPFKSFGQKIVGAPKATLGYVKSIPGRIKSAHQLDNGTELERIEGIILKLGKALSGNNVASAYINAESYRDFKTKALNKRYGTKDEISKDAKEIFNFDKIENTINSNRKYESLKQHVETIKNMLNSTGIPDYKSIKKPAKKIIHQFDPKFVAAKNAGATVAVLGGLTLGAIKLFSGGPDTKNNEQPVEPKPSKEPTSMTGELETTAPVTTESVPTTEQVLVTEQPTEFSTAETEPYTTIVATTEPVQTTDTVVTEPANETVVQTENTQPEPDDTKTPVEPEKSEDIVRIMNILNEYGCDVTYESTEKIVNGNDFELRDEAITRCLMTLVNAVLNHDSNAIPDSAPCIIELFSDANNSELEVNIADLQEAINTIYNALKNNLGDDVIKSATNKIFFKIEGLLIGQCEFMKTSSVETTRAYIKMTLMFLKLAGTYNPNATVSIWIETSEGLERQFYPLDKLTVEQIYKSLGLAYNLDIYEIMGISHTK